jgi:hypothetical protein
MRKILMFWIMKLEIHNARCFIKYDVTAHISYFCGHGCIFLQYYRRWSYKICVCLYDLDLLYKTKVIVFDQLFLSK